MPSNFGSRNDWTSLETKLLNFGSGCYVSNSIWSCHSTHSAYRAATMNGIVKRAILRWRQMLKWIMGEMKKRF